MKRFLVVSMIVFGTAMQLAAQVNVLDKRYTLNYTSTPIELILQDLEKDGLSFTYSPEVFDVKRRVSLNVNNQTLEAILNRLFDSQGHELMLMNDQVIIRKKRERRLTSPQKSAPKLDGKNTDEANSSNRTEKVEESSIANSSHTSPADSLIVDARSAVGLNTQENKSTTRQNDQDISSTERIDEPLPNINTSQKSLPLTFITVPRYVKVSNSPFLPSFRRIPIRTQIVELSEVKRVKSKSPKRRFAPVESGVRYSASAYTGMTQVDTDLGIMIGGRALYNFNPAFGVGFGGAAFISPSINDLELNGNYRKTGGYGGFFLEYSPGFDKILHLNYHILIGGGGATYIRQADLLSNPIGVIEDSQAIFVMEPGMTLEYTFLKWFRVGLDLTYRYNSSATLRYQSSGEGIFRTGDLRGLNFSLVLKVGRF